MKARTISSAGWIDRLLRVPLAASEEMRHDMPTNSEDQNNDEDTNNPASSTKGLVAKFMLPLLFLPFM